jgi:phosphoribosylamine--glycine ligase
MVLEFNTRFGDPETQAMLMRMETDVLELLDAAIDRTLGRTADPLDVILSPGASVCVIAASSGYPGKYESGKMIFGLDEVGSSDEASVFHSGTAVKDGALVTAGGRVLGITAMSAEGLEAALAKAYAMLAKISFEGMQYRRDIGWRALDKEPGALAKEQA